MAKSRVKLKISKNPKALVKDLGLDPSEALQWEVRHAVTSQILRIADEQKATAADLASRAGTSRARTTKLLKGDAEGFSLDLLLRILGALGQKIELRFLRAS